MYRTRMPVKPFGSAEQARQWANGLVDFFNQEHRQSAIKFITPELRHLGQDVQLLQKCSEIYAHARDQNSQRWSINTGDWLANPLP